MTARPASVTRAVRVLISLVLVTGVTTVLTWLQRDELVIAWAKGNRTASDALARGGLAEVESTLPVPGFVAIAVTSFVVLSALVWVLGVFFYEGFDWARWTLAVTVLSLVFGAVLCIVAGVPLLFEVLAVVISAICLVLLFFLLHRDTHAYMRAVRAE